MTAQHSTKPDAHRITLPKQVMTYEGIHTVLSSAILILATGVLHRFWLDQIPMWVMLGLWGLFVAVGLVEVCVMNPRLVKWFAAEIDANQCRMLYGRWITKDIHIRYGAIVSVDVEVGPILRHLGLAKVTLHSISSVPSIPAMAERDAQYVQRVLTDAIAQHHPHDKQTAEAPVGGRT